jgi:hypothetical protein
LEKFVSRLRFALSNHTYRIYKDYHEDFLRESLVFNSARISKGIGPVIISREFWNGEGAEKFATHWESNNAAEKEFFGNSVTINNLDNALLAKMTKWNQRYPDDRYTDAIHVGRQMGFDGLDVHIHMPTDQFCRLLQLDWRAKVLNLTVDTKVSFNELKLGLSTEQKDEMKKGKVSISDDFKCEITGIEIEIEALRTAIELERLDSVSIARRIFRFVLGR